VPNVKARNHSGLPDLHPILDVEPCVSSAIHELAEGEEAQFAPPVATPGHPLKDVIRQKRYLAADVR
jgi:hypothetical protein